MSQVKNYAIGLMNESTPGTYEPPVAGTDFIEMSEIPKVVTDQESIEIKTIRGSLGERKDKRGEKIATADLSLPFRGSGNVSSNVPDIARIEQLLIAGLGTRNRHTSNDTVSGSGSTTTVIDTTADDYNLGDPVKINDEIRVVKLIPGPNQITLNKALSAAPSDTDVIYRGSSIKPDSSDNTKLSLTRYNEPVGIPGWREKLIGATVSKLTLQNLTNGDQPSLLATLEASDWEVAANITNSITPVFENSEVLDNLNAQLYINGIAFDSNNLQLDMEFAAAKKKVITNASGILETAKTSRKISGQFDYWPTPSDITFFDHFKDNDTLELFFIFSFYDSSDSPVPATSIIVYMPEAQFKTATPEEEDSFEKRTIQFKAFEGAALDQEIFVGLL